MTLFECIVRLQAELPEGTEIEFGIKGDCLWLKISSSCFSVTERFTREMLTRYYMTPEDILVNYAILMKERLNERVVESERKRIGDQN